METVLLVYDQPAKRKRVTALLRERGYRTVTAADVPEAQEKLSEEAPDVVLVDCARADRSMLDFLRRMRAKNPELPALVIIAAPFSAEALKIAQLGGGIYLEGSEGQEELLTAVQKAAERVRQAKDHRSLVLAFENKLRELSTLNEVGIALNSYLDLDELLENFIRLLSEVLRVEIASLMLIDEQTHVLRIRAARGLDPKIVHKVRVQLGTGVSGHVAREGKPLKVDDMEKDKRFRSAHYRQYNRGSFCCVPLKVKDRTIGVINVTNRKTDEPFSEHDLELLTTFSNQAAIAIENARLYQTLRQANENLKKLERLKSEFLSTVSHELRTPLTTIIGYCELLLDGTGGALAEKQQEYADRILEKGEQLLDLINKILDFSEIESKRFVLEFTRVAPRRVILDIERTLHPMASAKGITLRTEIPRSLRQIHADYGRLRQILLNLVTNAIKFTYAGGIVRIKAQHLDDFVQFSVIDNGIGIPEDQLEQIFERFYQADGSLTREFQGTGLGLALVRSLVDLHGGRIWVESRVGKGSTFSFIVPTAAHISRRSSG